jgi:apolipoprotein N-acyltransferase
LPAHAVLLTGSVRRARDASDATRYYNSVAIVAETPAGPAVIAHYDKHHLVPFGEYLPLQGLLRRAGLAQLAPYDDGFTPGGGPWVWSAAGPPFAPLICYEAIFPGELYPRGQRPEWLVAVTNDAWFGDTSGPRQHLDQARLRSIETGLPMARSANTGISALIDAKGRLLSRIRLYTEGRIDAPLPKPLAPTLYSRIGDVGFLILFLVVLFLGFAPPSPARVRR